MKVLVAIRDWLGAHKKLTATIVGLAVAAIPEKFLDDAAKTRLAAVLVAYILGQGLADVGKEKAKVEFAAAQELSRVPDLEIATELDVAAAKDK